MSTRSKALKVAVAPADTKVFHVEHEESKKHRPVLAEHFEVIGIDPGPKVSTWCVYDPKRMCVMRLVEGDDNERLIHLDQIASKNARVAIEWIQSYGTKVGNEVLFTANWCGGFYVAAKLHGLSVAKFTRPFIKSLLLGEVTGGDAAVKRALLDMLGGYGTASTPGPLAYMRGRDTHAWACLAVAVVAAHGRTGIANMRQGAVERSM